jgi:endonuclease/exonuclease/phosphatase family metal-dependent hydrolase
MKVVSWNTYLAPTMPDRYRRADLIATRVRGWIDDGVDVIGLQELNDMVIGPIGCVYLYFNMWEYCWVWLQQIIDMMMLLEGIILPFRTYSHICDTVISTVPSEYTITRSPLPKKCYDVHGVVTITRMKPCHQFSTSLPADFVGIAGMNVVRGNDVTIINVHIVPNLSNRTFTYRMVNRFNKLWGYDIHAIQLHSLDIINNCKIDRRSTRTIVVMGDFNIKRIGEKERYEKIIDTLGLTDTAPEMVPTEHDYESSNQYSIDQIDYIFTNADVVQPCVILGDTLNESDHYPIYTVL